MHIDFILDGNGRWASNKGLPRAIGHKKGAENVETILRQCIDLNIDRVTLYAFSTENWDRPVYEVKALMNLFKYYLNKKLIQLHAENVKVSIIGEIEPFPKIIKKYIQNLTKLTKDNDGMYLNLALNYGGRAEIVRATKRIGLQLLQNKISIEEVNEKNFALNLDTGMNHIQILLSGQLVKTVIKLSFMAICLQRALFLRQDMARLLKKGFSAGFR